MFSSFSITKYLTAVFARFHSQWDKQIKPVLLYLYCFNSSYRVWCWWLKLCRVSASGPSSLSSEAKHPETKQKKLLFKTNMFKTVYSGTEQVTAVLFCITKEQCEIQFCKATDLHDTNNPTNFHIFSAKKKNLKGGNKLTRYVIKVKAFLLCP